jgi:hypothetical protein
MAGPLESGTAGVLKKEPPFFLASIGVSVVAALEQAERMRKKYNYGENVSRKNLLMLKTNLFRMDADKEHATR